MKQQVILDQPSSHADAVTRRRKGASLEQSRKKLILPFLLPALLLYVILFIVPAVGAFYISLNDWNGFTSNMHFIGLANYKKILSDPIYWKSFWNTVKILVFVGITVFAFGFLFTGILSFLPGKKIVRAILFFPNIVAPIALSILWGFLFNPEIGPVNTFFRKLHMAFLDKQWLGPELIFTTLCIGMVWIYTGFYTVIIMAGVEKIPKYYYEAAELDGASRIRQFFTITLPLTWDVVSVAIILWVINAIKTFEFIYAFAGTGNNPPTEIWTSAIYMYMVAFGTRTPIYALGYGTAIAVTMVFLIAVLVFLLRRILFREKLEF